MKESNLPWIIVILRDVAVQNVELMGKSSCLPEKSRGMLQWKEIDLIQIVPPPFTTVELQSPVERLC